MSIHIKAKVICDGECGTFIEGNTGTRTTTAFESHSDALAKAEHAGWITLHHGRYYPNRHFCPACQDKPLPKLKSNKKNAAY